MKNPPGYLPPGGSEKACSQEILISGTVRRLLRGGSAEAHAGSYAYHAQRQNDWKTFSDDREPAIANNVGLEKKKMQ